MNNRETKIMQRAGFEEWNSGGNIMLFRRACRPDDRLEFLISDEHGGGLPERMNGLCGLGLYDSETGEEIGSWYMASVTDALQAVDWFDVHFAKFIATRVEVRDGWYYGAGEEVGIYKTPHGPHLHIEQHEWSGPLYSLEARLFLDWECAELYRGFRFPGVAKHPEVSANA